jgi:predicted metal-binding protein
LRKTRSSDSERKDHTEISRNLGRPLEVLHLGTCMKLAMETAECPIDFDNLKPMLETKFGVEVVLGTHTY